MSPTRVLILYNEPVLPTGHPDAVAERDVVETAEHVQQHLNNAGMTTHLLGASHDPNVVLAGFRAFQPDVVFNLFEGTADHGDTEAYMEGLMQWLGIPYTGCPFDAATLGRRKHLTKYLLRGAGLPTADFFVVEDLPVPANPLGWPVFVKPTMQDASIGVDMGSVITSQAQLIERVEYLRARYPDPILVERYIAGREFIVGLIETPQLQPLPIAEIEFHFDQPGFWPIVTYAGKWAEDSLECIATPPVFRDDLAPAFAAHLRDLAVRAFRLVGCRDYARVDFRVAENGIAYILEVNPNPAFHPTAGLAKGLQRAGWTHEAFTVQLVNNALRRQIRPNNPEH